MAKNKVIHKSSPIQYFFIFLIVVVFVLGYYYQSETLLGLSVFVLFLHEVIFCVKNTEKHIALLLFLFAFFTFLMGRLIMPVFFDIEDDDDIFFSNMIFKKETILHTYLSVFISLLVLYLSYCLYNKKENDNLLPQFDVHSDYVKVIRKYSKFAVWLTIPFMLLVVLDNIYYVITHGYVSKYMEYETSLPGIIIVLSALYEYFLYLYLGTLPSKKDCRWIILSYVLISIIKMAAGDRGECMTALFVVVYYYFLRNRLCPGGQKWIGKRGMAMLASAVPAVVVILFSIAYLRDDNDVKGDNMTIMMAGFFYQQSASMNVVACEYEDEKQLPQGKLYSIGPIIDYFTNNHLSRLIFGVEPYKVGTVELATKGHSLDPAITYLESPTFFFKGGGMGSSYIAEAYYDLGYLGIVLFNIFYGFVLAKVQKMNSKNVWLSLIALVIIRFIMYAPRARALGFVAAVFSVSFWPLALILHLIAKNVQTHSLGSK